MFIQRFDKFVTKFANLQIIRAIRSGLIYMMPLTLIGAIVLALLNLPIPAFQTFITNIFGDNWRVVGNAIYKGSLSIIAVLALITVSYAYSNEFTFGISRGAQSISIIITALASYIAFINDEESILNFANSGSTSMLKAIVIGIAASRLFIFFCSIRDKVIPEKPFTFRGDILLRASFRVVMPSFLTILCFCLLKLMITSIHFEHLSGGFFQKLNHRIMNGNDLISAIAIIFITHIFWFIGVHGGNVVMYSVAYLSDVNPGIIYTKEFFDIFIYLGGSGATLGLLIALLIAGTRHNENNLAKFSLLPGIFNINEMIVYGLPVLFNPYYLLPFLLTPVLLLIVTTAGMMSGLLPPIVETVQWTTPVFVSGYLSTGSAAGAIMQGINLLLSVIIYLPFIKLQERHQQDSRYMVFKQLVSEIRYIQEEKIQKMISRNDEIGDMARSLAWELENELNNGIKTIYLEYQPKVNFEGRVIGAEALLRWDHPVYGYVSPLVLLAITDEIGMTSKLGTWIIRQGFKELKNWHMAGYDNLYLSVNLSPLQLKEDEQLVTVIRNCIDETNLNSKFMEIELTENATIDPTDEIKNRLGQIRELGVSISIDDFGMGHSSLLYLCNLYANVVKLDTSLIHSITTDYTRENIVKYIISLCSELGVTVVAEGVETEEQKNLLMKLGCNCYQGYYFSRSLSCERFTAFIEEHGIHTEGN